MTFEISSI